MPSAMPQPKPQGRPQGKPRQVKHSDFSEAYAGRLVTITLANGAVLKGIVVEARRFWIQVMVDGKAHYVNKAYIIEIVPG
jgi:alkyl hydroperoxide reductase subunit AhpF